ncbi:MAG: tetratricopeptide repeat protein, partial [Candidatus Eisenbacteria bacterium]
MSRKAAKPPREPTNSPATPDPGVPITHPAFLLALLVAAACVVAVVTYRILDTDLWQHLAVGREIVREGKVPATQIWTWPLFGQPDVPPSWGFRVLLYKFWELGGMPGLFVWRWLTTLAALAIAWFAGRRMGATGFSALVVMVWAALPLRLRAEPRPETLVFVLIALQLLVHESLRHPPASQARVRPGRPVAWRWPAVALPALALVWANVHLSYWLGLALQLIYMADAWWAGRRSGRRGARDDGSAWNGEGQAWITPLALLFLLSVAASFLNPGGWKTLAQPIEYWTTWRHELIYQQISELEPVVWRDNVRNLLWVLAAGWPVLILLRARRAGFDPAEIAIAALFLVQGLGTRRFLGFLAVAAVPFVARDLAHVLGGLRSPRWAAAPWARAAVAVALCLGGLAAEWSNPLATPGVGIEPQWRPLAACDFIERHGIRGRAYNHYEFGGYLLWRFHPQRDRLPFMDIHQTGTVEDRRLSALALLDQDAWAALDRRHRFDWALFMRFRAGQDRSTDILDADTAFALVFLDDVAALYVRRSGAMADVAERLAYRVLRGGFESAPEIAAASADSSRRPALRADLERLRGESPFHATALSLEANILFREGRMAEAREALRRALAIDPRFPFAQARLAEVALALGRPAEALAAARAAMAMEGRTDRLADVMFAARGRAGPPAEPIARAALPDEWPRG